MAAERGSTAIGERNGGDELNAASATFSEKRAAFASNPSRHPLPLGNRREGAFACRCKCDRCPTRLLTISLPGSSFCRAQGSLKECQMHGRLRIAFLVAAVVGLLTPIAANRQSTEASNDVTFTKDIAPILQRSCQRCHRPNSVAPMSLLTYEDARPWARSMKTRTSLRWQRGAMP